MQTDALFHEFFELVPQALFELLNLEPPCPYTFSSPVVKRTERRMDGLLEPDAPDCPRFFLEVQGYRDESIYWRLEAEVALYFEARPALNGSDWRAILLFVDEAHDPGIATLGPKAQAASQWLIHGTIPALLARSQHASPVLNVLRPLEVQTETAMRQRAPQWSQAIRTMDEWDEATQLRLLTLLVQFMAQKFTHLERKEITQMLQLTPFEETAFGRSYYHEAYIDLLSGQLATRFGVASEEASAQLEPLDVPELKSLSNYLLQATSYAQVEAWIAGRLADREPLESSRTVAE